MQKSLQYFVASLGILVFINVISLLFKTQLELINIALIHLIPIIMISLRGNMQYSMATSAIAVITFDLLYVPPAYSFDVHDIYYIWSFMIFFVVGYAITKQAQRIHINEMKETILNTLSHDLKTPLSAILGNTSLLLDEKNLDEKIQLELLTNIKLSSEQMSRLISDLLDSARFHNKEFQLKKQWCDLEDILGIALKELQSRIENMEIVVNVSERLELFWADQTLLVHLFVNLIDNATKYSLKDRQIVIDLLQEKNAVKVKFFNESDAIAEEQLANIFDKFYRIENSADIDGSGIGLSICKSIVTAHQGSIRAYNVKSGVIFEVIFPIMKYQSLAT